MILDVRMKLLARSQTLSGWARTHGLQRTTVFRAVKGQRHGPSAKKIIKMLQSELGLHGVQP